MLPHIEDAFRAAARDARNHWDGNDDTPDPAEYDDLGGMAYGGPVCACGACLRCAVRVAWVSA